MQLVKRKTPLVLVKPKTEGAATAAGSKVEGGAPKATAGAQGSAATVAVAAKASEPSATETASKPAAPAGLSLLAAYSDSSEDSNWPLHLSSIYIKSMFVYKLTKLYAKAQINVIKFSV